MLLMTSCKHMLVSITHVGHGSARKLQLSREVLLVSLCMLLCFDAHASSLEMDCRRHCECLHMMNCQQSVDSVVFAQAGPG